MRLQTTSLWEWVRPRQHVLRTPSSICWHAGLRRCGRCRMTCTRTSHFAPRVLGRRVRARGCDVVSIRIRTVHNASHGIVKDVSQSAVQESNRSTACCSPNRHDLFVSVGFSHVFLLISFAQSASAKLPSDQLRSVGFGKMFWVHLFVSLSLLRQLVSLRMLRPRVSLGTAHGRTRSFTEDDQVR